MSENIIYSIITVVLFILSFLGIYLSVVLYNVLLNKRCPCVKGKYILKTWHIITSLGFYIALLYLIRYYLKSGINTF